MPTSVFQTVPLRICTSAEMKHLDEIAEKEYQIRPQILMENAGRAAVQILFDPYPRAGREKEILVFAGKGNNAGDAFVVARRLLCLERRVRIFHLVSGDVYQGATRENFEILKKMDARMIHLERAAELENFFATSPERFLAIDGIFGTGLKGPLEGIFYDVVELINNNVDDVISLDIPSGVSGDTGHVHGNAILADLTISFGFPKIGHFLPPGAGMRGQVVNVDISLPPEFRHQGDKFLLTKSPMRRLLKERDRYGHKNSFGHTLIVGGSPGHLGAVAMAARACHKMGTGLVTVATWADSFDPLLVKLPDETMAVPIEVGASPEVYRRYFENYSSIVVGPGLGKRPEAKEVVEELIANYDGPLVLDADALNTVSYHHLHSLVAKRRAPTLLTPHPGEMARLLGVPKDMVVDNPVESLKKAVDKTFSTVLLKGAATLMSSPDNLMYLNHYPNDGMATAGSGDVLAGMIGGLVGQQLEAFEAMKLAVYLHSLAGGKAAEIRGHRSMTAPDIIENIGNAFKTLKTQEDPSFPEEGRANLL